MLLTSLVLVLGDMLLITVFPRFCAIHFLTAAARIFHETTYAQELILTVILEKEKICDSAQCKSEFVPHKTFKIPVQYAPGKL